MRARRRPATKVVKTLDVDMVAKLVRLLGSDKDGEVVAAVAALRRVLHAADLDLHNLADAAVVGLKPQHHAAPSWEPPAPDRFNWESMAWFCHYWRRHMLPIDRDYVVDVLLGRAGFDLGRATPDLMRRLERIVANIEVALAADIWR